MKVFFENSCGVRRLIGEPPTWREATGVIHRFLEDHNYKAPYWRMARLPNEVMIDVGSHSEFFYIEVPENFLLEEQINEKR